jgi:CRISPR system Cascade subunit CasB
MTTNTQDFERQKVFEARSDTYDALICTLKAWARAADGDGPNPGKARANLACLRRGLGQPRDAVLETVRVIEPMLYEDTKADVADTFYIVAPLFALHREWDDDQKQHDNMGAHFHKLAEDGELPAPNVQKRFEDVRRSSPADLPEALRHAITLLKRKDIPVNWSQLCRDVDCWLRDEQSRRYVQLSWDKAFWRLPTNPKA